MKEAAVVSGNNKLQTTLAVLGLSGIVLLFFPFAADSGVADGWRLLGRLMLPVVLFPFLISSGYFARLAISKLPRWSNLVGYAAAILVAGIALSDWHSSLGDVVIVILLSIVPAVCIFLGIRYGLDRRSDTRGLVALQSIYAVHLSFFLAAFIDTSHNIGYWIAALAMVIALLQIGLQVKRKPSALCLAAPSAAFWAWGVLETWGS